MNYKIKNISKENFKNYGDLITTSNKNYESINKDTIDSFFDLANIQILSNPFANFSNMTNTQALGSVLYTDYILYFQLSGVILLVAMIGSIVLTLRDRTGVRRQVIGQQLERDSSSTVLKEVESGEGVDI